MAIHPKPYHSLPIGFVLQGSTRKQKGQGEWDRGLREKAHFEELTSSRDNDGWLRVNH
ncbi:unnamed protein product [Haemonchus placei]|uniref:Uncharacterized protein n=1 Tax=Haemonchus placei TaxID=6290 RepID=A0A0N4VWF2_HAEPC|nr:unnamed protein product [Haemonchus placei]